MNHRHLLLSAIAVGCALHIAAASAQTGAGAARPAENAASQTAASRLSKAETSFLKDAAHNGHAEVKSSQLALQKVQNPKLRAFAQQMVDDHTKVNQELEALAASKNVRVPDGPSMVQEAKLKLLNAADGADFDKRYAETMGLQAHKDTIALFEKGARNARDPEVKAFAEKTLPSLKHHLEMAQQLAPDVGVTAEKTEKSRKP
ncbi:DUF4142 domain-containing protein [Acidovorax sp. GBBC 3334]|uniref:DUF4142 domain-containing protein n=1 Tax=unclassified Acidovorax TaxID=2684926 RepID=UPI002302DCFF|nr:MULTISPECIES: DUF4142 domain-containing protein [unclassified Acidovorax]MDA8457137.1 DUF4142 domain-containing protein [Acidovorax sp. GBBC 3334]MDA8521935.1 DUF4142 domain-containing protein [Acidovorax sp. NCPPB 4044]